MIFSICGSAGAGPQPRLSPSSTRQLPILVALNEENPTLDGFIIYHAPINYNTFLYKFSKISPQTPFSAEARRSAHNFVELFRVIFAK